MDEVLEPIDRLEQDDDVTTVYHNLESLFLLIIQILQAGFGLTYLVVNRQTRNRRS